MTQDARLEEAITEFPERLAEFLQFLKDDPKCDVRIFNYPPDRIVLVSGFTSKKAVPGEVRNDKWLNIPYSVVQVADNQFFPELADLLGQQEVLSREIVALVAKRFNKVPVTKAPA